MQMQAYGTPHYSYGGMNDGYSSGMAYTTDYGMGMAALPAQAPGTVTIGPNGIPEGMGVAGTRMAGPGTASPAVLVGQTPDWSVIIKDRLFLGNGGGAADPETMRHLGVTHVLNMAVEEPTHEGDPRFQITYKHIPWEDNDNEDITASFPHIYHFIQNALAQGGRVYAHCHMGRSRGASAVIYYLMVSKDWSFQKAYTYVRRKRPITLPNWGYVCNLIHYTYTHTAPSAQKAPLLVPAHVVLEDMMFAVRTYCGDIPAATVERTFMELNQHIAYTLRKLRQGAMHQQGLATAPAVGPTGGHTGMQTVPIGYQGGHGGTMAPQQQAMTPHRHGHAAHGAQGYAMPAQGHSGHAGHGQVYAVPQQDQYGNQIGYPTTHQQVVHNGSGMVGMQGAQAMGYPSRMQNNGGQAGYPVGMNGHGSGGYQAPVGPAQDGRTGRMSRKRSFSLPSVIKRHL